MRHLLFLAVAIGIFAAIDAIQFKGENRAALWRKLQNQAHIINYDIERSINDHLW